MSRRAICIAAMSLLAIAVALAPASGAGRGHAERERPWLAPLKDAGAVIWAVGDGAEGGSDGRAVGAMVSAQPFDRFIYLGDVYESGTAAEFRDNYAPAFGHLATRTAPTIGNHEWGNRRKGYLPYWTGVRGRRPPAWYAIAASGWQILGLNSMASHGQRSQQVRWLRDELRDSERFGTCRIAFTHHPRFSAGRYDDNRSLKPLWARLRGRASIVLAGHEHNYQRFHPIGGLAQLIVGTGGYERYGVHPDDARLAYSWQDGFGALRIELNGREASLEFIDTEGNLLDSSTVTCAR